MKIVSRPQLHIDPELISICIEIEKENKSDVEWSEVESSGMFQSDKYCGGYDSIEQSFWFSYYDQNKKEWWFEINTADLKKIISGQLQYLDLYEPN